MATVRYLVEDVEVATTFYTDLLGFEVVERWGPAIAMVRRGYAPDHIDSIKDAYKRLFRDNGAPMSDKLLELKSQYEDVPAVLQLCESLQASADGVHGRALEVHRADDKRTVEVK